MSWPEPWDLRKKLKPLVEKTKSTLPLSHEACRDMLCKWLEGDESLTGPATWNTLIQNLINSGLVDLADNLKRV